MSTALRITTWLSSLALFALAATLLAARALGAGGSGLVPTTPAPVSGVSGTSSGGAAIIGGGLAPTHHVTAKLPPPPSKHAHGRWLTGVTITEYWPARESWFKGRLVKAPGLSGLHRIDWLYSATGVSMQGDGVGLDGRQYHIDALGDGGWVTADGVPTDPSNGWAAGAPYWRAGGFWRSRRHAVTFPLAGGGWSNGAGRAYVPLPHVTFAPGPSLPLHFDQSIAVDPGVIPLGSRVYVPAYRHDGHGGWFLAQDTGGAINGRHIDVYRSPPASPTDSGQYLTGDRIFVIKPRK
jgi:3D domain